MSVGQVMAVLAGGGLLSAPLESLESGADVPTGMDVALLSYAFPIDDMVAIALREGEPVEVCAKCGCSRAVPCVDRHGLACIRTDAGRCSGCCPVESYLRDESRARQAIAARGREAVPA